MNKYMNVPTKRKNILLLGVAILLVINACVPKVARKKENTTVPSSYNGSATQDTTNSAKIKWKNFFTDPNLNALIDTALKGNQEMNIMVQEIVVAKSEVRARKGLYLPFVNVGVGAGVERAARYTRNGAVDAKPSNDRRVETLAPVPAP